MIVQNQTAIDK